MTTGSYWNVSNPKKPYGELDVDGDILDIPWDWTDVCEDAGATLASHVMLPLASSVDNPLMVETSAIVAANLKVLARIMVDQASYDSALHFNQKYGITCRATLSDGQQFDKTLWFRLVSH